MLAQNPQQHRAARQALDAKRGRMDPRKLNGQARELFDVLTEGELEEYAWGVIPA
ncbi:DUF3008 family protein [Wenxinia saemankumensis]|uniref:Protein of unknwon function n=1 Tax=Wenxinia saemankumensis TaxID=1447782 RepID=A0A1M6HB52_9RHOB|nr:DUF3008 family protein [Wenxinia saemankumensis]SHJ19343.1 Protein of unknwon function [Wenxinia saemankumensis]